MYPKFNPVRYLRILYHLISYKVHVRCMISSNPMAEIIQDKRPLTIKKASVKLRFGSLSIENHSYHNKIYSSPCYETLQFKHHNDGCNNLLKYT